MEAKDIIGKEFECFEFKSNRQLNYGRNHISYLGRKATVLRPNSTYPQFTIVEVILDNYKKEETHYPTAGIIEQLEAKEFENLSIEEILNTMKMLTSKI